VLRLGRRTRREALIQDSFGQEQAHQNIRQKLSSRAGRVKNKTYNVDNFYKANQKWMWLKKILSLIHLILIKQIKLMGPI
jgi:hypothetical protein